MAEWRRTTLDQLVKLQRGHDLPASQRKPGPVPVVGAAGPSGYHDTAIVKAPGVVLGRAGASMGRATFCTVDFWPLNTSLYVTDFLGNDPAFTFYLLGQIDFSGYNSGAAQPMLNRNYITQIAISLPEPDEQRSIARVLGVLDDKIAVNERIASTTDGLANSIFALRTQGAQQQPMSQVVTPVLGGTPDRRVHSYWGPGFPWASAKDVAGAASGVVVDTAEHITKEAASSTRAKPLPERSVVLTARGTVGAVARVTRPTAINQSCYAFTPGEVPSAILFHLVRTGAENMLAVAHGTVFSTVNMKTFDHVRVPVIDGEKRAGLEEEIAPLHRQIEARIEESRALAALRDTLLPQLMSGKLRVRDAERIVEDAV